MVCGGGGGLGLGVCGVWISAEGCMSMSVLAEAACSHGPFRRSQGRRHSPDPCALPPAHRHGLRLLDLMTFVTCAVRSKPTQRSKNACSICGPALHLPCGESTSMPINCRARASCHPLPALPAFPAHDGAAHPPTHPPTRFEEANAKAREFLSQHQGDGAFHQARAVCGAGGGQAYAPVHTTLHACMHAQYAGWYAGCVAACWPACRRPLMQV